MLSVSKAIKAGQGDYYLSLSATDDYYLNGLEPKGFWNGEGANALGLRGEIENDQFRNLLRGLSADGGKKLVRNADSERRAGWDLTWSVPKSVSVLWSQSDAQTRAAIEACLRKAVSVGISHLENVAGFTRRGEDGLTHEKAKLIFACFEHSTSRALDPQLHIHTILINTSVRFDGTTGTVEPRRVYCHQMEAGGLFRAELAKELEKTLGLRARREGRAFQILGVDEGLMEEFSKRRAEIERALAKRGLSGGKASEIAALDTREKKDPVPRKELFRRWHEAGKAHGWTEREVSNLIHAPFPKRDPEREKSNAMRDGLLRLTSGKSHFTVRELTQALAEEAQGRGLGAEDIFQMRDTLLLSHELVLLCQDHTDRHFTTKEILELERKLLREASEMAESEITVKDASAIVSRVISQNPELSSEQREALEHVTLFSQGIRVVSGMAGTGKSTLFKAAREVWEKEGLTVIGASLSGKAARGLEESSGIKSQTLHRTLYDIERGALRLNENTVLLIDEAAMVGTRQLGRVIEECLKANATLVLAGDARQLQAIELGGAFLEISNRFGAAKLTEIRRQRDEWAKEAVRSFADGDAQEALSAYAARGFVSEETDGRWSAMERLVDDWKESADLRDKNSIILAGTNADVTALNRMAQEALQLKGRLGTTPLSLGKESIFEGDRVIFTKNSMALSVMNGGRESILKQCFAQTACVSSYDYLLLDNPPSISLVVMNSLVASKYFLVPCSAEYLPMVGLTLLGNSIGRMEKIAIGLTPLGVVLTSYSRTERICRQVETMLSRELGDKLFETRIRVNTKAKSAPSVQKTIFDYEDSPKGRGTEDFTALGQEFLARLERGERVTEESVAANG